MLSNKQHRSASSLLILFGRRSKKYHGSLQAGAHGSRLKIGWMKIRRALCKEDDVKQFQADLLGHTECILMMMTTLQLYSTESLLEYCSADHSIGKRLPCQTMTVIVNTSLS